MKKHEYTSFGQFLRPYMFREVMILFLMLSGTLLSLASPYFLKIIIDDIIPSKDFGALFLILGTLLLLYILRLGIDFWGDYQTTWVSNRIINDIKMKMFSSLVRMPYTYFEENKAGDIIQKSTIEINKIQSFLTNSVVRLINNLFLLAGLTIMLCLLNFELFILSVSIVPVSILVNRAFNKKIKKQVEQASKEEGDVYSFYIDRIRNFKLIKDFNAGDREQNLLNGKWQSLFQIYQTTSVYSSLARNISTFFVVSIPLIILGYGGYQAMQGLLTMGSIVAFIQYMNRFYAPVNDMILLYSDYVKAKVSMERVMPLLFPSDANLPVTQPAPHPEQVHRITLRNVHMSFGERSVLKGVNLELTKGKKYGLVGGSGSGKTTLLKIICKIYQPPKGEVLLNADCSLSAVQETWWREKVTIINQETLFFRETVRYNIAYGRPGITEEEIWSVVDELELGEYIRQMPQQLDTIVGEGEDSILLSGGQQQIIGLLRAYIKDADIVILDESTCALDSIQERKLVKKLYKRFQDKIFIVVSHRLSSLKNLDEIMVLMGGEIVETGKPDKLMVSGGYFHQLFRAQIDISTSLITSPSVQT